jgi:hypothetical protein
MSYIIKKLVFAPLLGKEEHWIWTYSDESLTDSFWGTNCPNLSPGNTDDCALMVVQANSFWWQDSSCLTSTVQSKAVAPICQHKRIETTGNCPSGWVEFEAHCYFLNIVRMIWPNAENDCIQRGGHLASIHSQEEQYFVYSISTIHNWLGASDLVTEVGFYSYYFCFFTTVH